MFFIEIHDDPNKIQSSTDLSIGRLQKTTDTFDISISRLSRLNTDNWIHMYIIVIIYYYFYIKWYNVFIGILNLIFLC